MVMAMSKSVPTTTRMVFTAEYVWAGETFEASSAMKPAFVRG